MASSGLQPIIGPVFDDEFIFGGRELLKEGTTNKKKVDNRR